MTVNSTIFWNNKGGTGKTSLAFQAITTFAHLNQSKRILVIDVCPQANLSELLLGGLEGNGSDNLLKVQGRTPRATVGGYFQSRLPSPYSFGSIPVGDYLVVPSQYNSLIPGNIVLLAGDPLLELQANSMSTLANNQIPGTDTWVKIVSWLKDFISETKSAYDYIFTDANPSFSIYTQVAMAAANRVVLPVMADDSSRRAIQNAFSLIYGLKLPSEIYAQHMFATRMDQGRLPLPKAHLVVKNRITQYMGSASGYRAILDSIDRDIDSIIRENPDLITFGSLDEGVLEIRDFQTTGVVAFARGTPFFALKPGKRSVGGRRVAIDGNQIRDRNIEIVKLAMLLK
ncbi:cellulose biosynthesis protein BcsQ [Rhizobium rosettiformans]|uniref:ParA family protein n=2 Tax=Rhizobium rosettiformans TaxID=1368430 RepID=A0A4S8QD39_9HYPH|nr:ParA family protein [Rhizobium rosettiformans]MBB5275138.1 cellulose biosynthesis protein BcsQ [Rhizobium rosettiformans]THV39039.1 ParA family protein [Rhizobium rosettiformans W3]